MWSLVLLFWFPDFTNTSPVKAMKEMTVLNVLQFKSEEACHQRLYDILAMPDSKGYTLTRDEKGQLQLLSANLTSKRICVKSELDIYEEYK